MSADRDVNRIVRSWLEEGVSTLPDRVLDTVLDQLPATPQRRAPWPVRRFGEMNNFAKFAVAAAAVAVVAVVGINLLPRSGGVGVPGPSPTSNPTQTPSPTQAPSPSSPANVNFMGNYVPGTTYVIANDPCCVGSSPMTFSVPVEGWSSFDFVQGGKNLPGGSDAYDLEFAAFLVGNVYTGGCHWIGTSLSPPVGPTVDDLANALNAQAGAGAPAPTAVTVGGFEGKKVELQIPEDVDVTKCDSDGDFPIFGRWYTGAPFGAAPWTFGKGQHDTVYILDVNGTRQVIDTMYLPGTSVADRAQLDQIVESIRFESPSASPSPSP
jgi:hypothetical protein